MTDYSKRLDKRPAIICPGGSMWLQGYEPKSCSLGCPGRSFFCGTFYVCSKCFRAFKSCKELKKHKKREIFQTINIVTCRKC